MKNLSEKLSVSNVTGFASDNKSLTEKWNKAIDYLGINVVVEEFNKYVDPDTSTEVLKNLVDRYHITEVTI
jgi:hypothetical protein